MFEIVNKEIEVMRKDHSKIKTNLSDQVFELKQKLKEQRSELRRYEKLSLKDKHFEEKGIQLQLEDLNDFQKVDEIDNYQNKINSFIIEGKIQSDAWVNVLITDITSSKIIHDYINYTRG